MQLCKPREANTKAPAGLPRAANRSADFPFSVSSSLRLFLFWSLDELLEARSIAARDEALRGLRQFYGRRAARLGEAAGIGRAVAGVVEAFLAAAAALAAAAPAG